MNAFTIVPFSQVHSFLFAKTRLVFSIFFNNLYSTVKVGTCCSYFSKVWSNFYAAFGTIIDHIQSLHNVLRIQICFTTVPLLYWLIEERCVNVQQLEEIPWIWPNQRSKRWSGIKDWKNWLSICGSMSPFRASRPRASFTSFQVMQNFHFIQIRNCIAEKRNWNILFRRIPQMTI